MNFAPFRRRLRAERETIRRVEQAGRFLVPYLNGLDLYLSHGYGWGSTLELVAYANEKTDLLGVTEALEALVAQHGGSLHRDIGSTYDGAVLALTASMPEVSALGDRKVVFHIEAVPMPDCSIEEREVSELVPATEEEVVIKKVRVAVCSDPVTGAKTETILG